MADKVEQCGELRVGRCSYVRFGLAVLVKKARCTCGGVKCCVKARVGGVHQDSKVYMQAM